MKKELTVKILGFIIVLFGGLFTVNAATRTVDNTSDSGSQTACTAAANDCSLRGAVTNASSGDVIDFSNAVFSTSQTINLATRIFLSGGKTLQINGPGASLLTITGTGNPNGLFYLFEGNTTIRNMTLANVTSGSAFAVSVTSTGVGTVENCIVNGITATNNLIFSGALSTSGVGLTINNTELYNNTIAIASSSSPLTINGVTVRNNITFGMSIGGNTTITNSVIKDNTGTNTRGIIFNQSGATLTISNSLFAGNIATANGSCGSAIALTQGNLVINNSTFSGNSATRGSAVCIQAFGSGSLKMNNSTIIGNNTPGGGAIENSTNEVSTIRNSIIAGNTGNSRPDLLGNINSASYNLLGIVDDRFTGFIDGNGNPINNNLVGTIANPLNAQIGTLADNGGTTQTHTLLSNSPARNAGNNCVLTANGCGDNNAALATDQRGVGFPRLLGTAVDIGATEGVDATNTFLFTPASLPIGNPNTAYSQQISVTGGTAPYSFAVVSGTLPTGITVSASGLLSGTTAQIGTFNFAVRAADADGFYAVKNYELLIGYYVTNANNSGAGSFRQLINDTPAGGTIRFDPAFFNVPRVIVDRLDVLKNLTIIGPGSGLLTINGGAAGRVFNMDGGITLTLSGIRFTNGNAGAGVSAGGILINGNSTFNATDIVVDTCTAGNHGGGIYVFGTLNLTNSTVNGNSAGQLGGGIFNDGTLTITNSFVSGNTSGFAGGIYNNSGKIATINDSTISNNTSSGGAGGIGNAGTLNVARSTFSGNSATFGGAITAGPSATVNNSTISGNTATTNKAGAVYINTNDNLFTTNTTITNNVSNGNLTGGIYNDGGSYNTRNSIIAGNRNANGGGNPDIFATVTSFGWNLIGNTNGANIVSSGIDGQTLTGNRLNVPGNLAPLGHYGGSTQTHALLPSSQAINNGDPGGSFFATDQRGAIRSVGTGDIGSFERNVGLDQATLPNGILSGAYNQTLTATRLSSFVDILTIKNSVFLNSDASVAPYTFSIITIIGQQLPPGLSLSSSGDLLGTPTQIGSFTFTVKATDADGMAGVAQYTILIETTPPTIETSAVTRQAGSTVSNSTIATVGDIQSGANGVTVTVTSANPSNGVTLSNIVNTNGTVTANIIAACGATNASFTLKATDGDSLMTTATLNVTISANTAPTLQYPTPPNIGFGDSLNVTPTTATDNGSISSYSILSVSPALTTAPTVNSSGVVSIVNAQPAGVHIITVRATDNCGAVTDSTITLTVDRVVTKTEDTNDGVCDADCSLREAIATITGGQTIKFSSLFDTPQTITIGGQFVVNQTYSIDASGKFVTISGNNQTRIFKLVSGGYLTFYNLTLTNGSGGNDGQGGGAVNVPANSSMVAYNSTFTNNTTQAFLSGGAILVAGGGVGLINSTVSGNSSAGNGGGVFVNGAGLSLVNSTITGNSGSGAGINNISGNVVALNSIIAGNNGNDFQGTLNSQGYNLIGNTSAANIIGDTTGNILNQNAHLAPLGNYGGTTKIHALLSGSPAINAGNNCILTANACSINNPALTTDQRGTGFPRLFSTSVDIGAFELENTVPVIYGETILRQQGSPISNSTIATVNGAESGANGITVTITSANPSNGVTVSNIVNTNGTVTADVVADHSATNASFILTATGTAGATATSTLTVNILLPKVVTKTADTDDGVCDADCSLREAIATASAGIAIEFASPLFDSPQTITLVSGELMINKTLTINGRSANLLTISGNNTSRVFNNTGNLSINGLTVANGNNGIAGGGIYNNGTLNVTVCSISDNTVNSTNNDTSGGGIFNNTGRMLTIKNSTISGNSVHTANASRSVNGGGILNGGIMNIINSTVSGNTANAASNGYGGGIYNSGTATFTNSTVTGNSVNGNGERLGGGIFRLAGQLISVNTIISGNSSAADPDVFGGLSLDLNNYIGGNARLAPLGNYGGTTQTHALLAGSPAINAGDNCVLTANACGNNNPALTTDQRGIGATRVIGSTVDIGGFEQNITFDQTSLPNGSTGLNYSQQLSATRSTSFADDDFQTETQNFAPASFEIVPAVGQQLPPGMTLSSDGLISGMPTMTGTFIFTVKATDTDGIAGASQYRLQVFSPTAANVSVSGKVITANGNGISNVAVTLTDVYGNTRMTQTTTFGYYSLTNLTAGETYSISVKAKGLTFAQDTLVLTLFEDATQIEFVSLE